MKSLVLTTRLSVAAFVAVVLATAIFAVQALQPAPFQPEAAEAACWKTIKVRKRVIINHQIYRVWVVKRVSSWCASGTAKVGTN